MTNFYTISKLTFFKMKQFMLFALVVLAVVVCVRSEEDSDVYKRYLYRPGMGGVGSPIGGVGGVGGINGGMCKTRNQRCQVSGNNAMRCCRQFMCQRVRGMYMCQ
ncbi:hypothetical protein LOTGIDRAFT_233528 [Lottia gigantea]|uniref:Uncharacterized protein n=1 Tax=Lottia gigantea TaxID=225164 RepID=V3ZID7_LOTGI|nr:hypothetical protein LOTGIDRAFT_233528 [Lottia gigantea]ESO91043.1 hypothetical protein LOTGIDRAFT_233528 [Lottia gigantea]